MKKKCIIFICIFIVFVLVADVIALKVISDKNKPKDTKSTNNNVESSLYDRSLDMIGALSELVADENYRNNVGLPKKLEGIVSSLLEMNYSKPYAVYRVANLDNILEFIISGVSVTLDDDIKKYIEIDFSDGICNMILSSYGSEAIAANAIFNINNVFTDENVTENEMFIYVYEDAYPVAVTYIIGENGAVLANASYLISDEFIGTDIDELEKLLKVGMIPLKLEEIK